MTFWSASGKKFEALLQIVFVVVNFEKKISAETTVTCIVNRIRYATEIFGYHARYVCGIHERKACVGSSMN